VADLLRTIKQRIIQQEIQLQDFIATEQSHIDQLDHTPSDNNILPTQSHSQLVPDEDDEEFDYDDPTDDTYGSTVDDYLNRQPSYATTITLYALLSSFVRMLTPHQRQFTN
jgi:hypothetical protein